MSSRPITEDDLQAYVDRALTARRLVEVEAYLADHSDVAARVRDYSQQRSLLRDALAPIADEPIPPELNPAWLVEARTATRARRRSFASWWAAAAAILLFVVGGVGGWSLRGAPDRPRAGLASLAQEATDSYVVYAPDLGRPVELDAANRSQLVTWASRRLDRPVMVPDLTASGYRFLGGRVVPTPHGPAVLYMFDNGSGVRLIMLLRNMAIDKDAPMREQAKGLVSTISWARNGLGFSLVGPLAPDALHPIADAARREFGSVI